LKRILTILMAFALTLIPPAAMAVVAPVDGSCPVKSDPCCEAPDGPACPTKATGTPVNCCVNCSLVCCAYLPVKAATLPVPSDVRVRCG
jgi:hypothetical protein